MTHPAGETIDRSVTGMVFDVKRFATGDGPGIRTLIFVKGCPLRCVWCANPESQLANPEIIFHRARCVGCGRCAQACPVGAISPDDTFGLNVDRDACTVCGDCVSACLYEAREVVGKTVSVGEMLTLIRRDRRFYDRSGGGVTLTGGEPLQQRAFSVELLKACRAAGIHTAMETCGFADSSCVDAVLPHLNLLFYDIKHMDPEIHRELTGQSNDLILGNLERAAAAFDEGMIIVRMPWVPGCNGDGAVLEQIVDFVATLPNIDHIEVMPYHRLGSAKYEGLGRRYSLHGQQPVARSDLAHLVEVGRARGVRVRIDSE